MTPGAEDRGGRHGNSALALGQQFRLMMVRCSGPNAPALSQQRLLPREFHCFHILVGGD